MKKLFGTDGIRGHANEFPLDPSTVTIIGSALTRCFRERLKREPRFVTGRDTRESGPAIEAAFHAGALAEGAQCESAGVITTPGVAYVTNAFEFDAGVVISASHNPYQDNGIKIFSPDGKKIDDETERWIEALPPPIGLRIGFKIGAHTFIVHLRQLQRVMKATREGPPRFDFGFGIVILLHHLLGLRRISPKIRRFDFFFELG